MTLRLNAHEDDALARLARSSNTSKNSAAAAAIDLAARRTDHPEFVRVTTGQLLARYSGLMERLAAA